MALLAVLSFGILTLWVPSRWPLTVFQIALFLYAAVQLPAWLGWKRSQVHHQPAWLLNPRDPAAQVAWLVTAATLWGVLQSTLGWTVDSYLTQQETVNWTANLCGLLLGAHLSKQGELATDRFLDALLAFATALATFGILTALSSPVGVIAWTFDVGTGQPTLGPFVYHNQYAAFAEVALAIAITRALLRPRPVLYLCAAALLFASVVASGSRGGTALCLAEVVVIPTVALWQGAIPRRIWIRTLAACLVSLAAGAAIAGWDFILSRFSEANPYALRADLARSSWAMFLDRPWTGFGLGTWPEVYPGYALYDAGLYVNQAHNDWAQWAAEGGILFLLIVLCVVLRILPPAVRLLWGLGFLAVTVHAFFDYPFQQRPALAAFLFTICGLLAGASSPGNIPPPSRSVGDLSRPAH